MKLGIINTHNWHPLQTIDKFCAEALIAIQPWSILWTLILIYIEECAQSKDTYCTD